MEDSGAFSDRMLNWVLESVGNHADFQSIERLKGGMSSLVHKVTLQKDRQIIQVVLRQFNNKEWVAAEPDLARHEAASLLHASQAAINTPMLIAFDETGGQCGIPAVLMSLLEGSVILNPENMEQWLNGIAEELVKIHAVSAEGFPWDYYTYGDIATLEIPSWTKLPHLWEQAIRIVQGTQPAYKPCFIHRDYHPTNILWGDGKVSGVVDWVNSCKGPAGIDVGHCRLNLAMLFGTEVADAFLSAYLRHAKGISFSYDPYWDLLSLVNIMEGTPTVYPGWTALGVKGLTDELMADRLDQFLQTLFIKK